LLPFDAAAFMPLRHYYVAYFFCYAADVTTTGYRHQRRYFMILLLRY